MGAARGIHQYVTEPNACSQRSISVKDKGLSAGGSVGSPMREKGTARHQLSKNPSRIVVRIDRRCPLTVVVKMTWRRKSLYTPLSG